MTIAGGVGVRRRGAASCCGAGLLIAGCVLVVLGLAAVTVLIVTVQTKYLLVISLPIFGSGIGLLIGGSCACFCSKTYDLNSEIENGSDIQKSSRNTDIVTWPSVYNPSKRAEVHVKGAPSVVRVDELWPAPCSLPGIPRFHQGKCASCSVLNPDRLQPCCFLSIVDPSTAKVTAPGLRTKPPNCCCTDDAASNYVIA